jgi:Putative transposase, YhgA-like
MTLFDNPPLHDFPDRAIRQAFDHRANLRDALSEAVPHLVARLDCERAEEVPRSFLLEDWRGRESDLLFRIPYRPETGATGAVFVVLLLEHQSEADPRMPLRLLLYAVLYWEQEWKE